LIIRWATKKTNPSSDIIGEDASASRSIIVYSLEVMAVEANLVYVHQQGRPTTWYWWSTSSRLSRSHVGKETTCWLSLLQQAISRGWPRTSLAVSINSINMLLQYVHMDRCMLMYVTKSIGIDDDRLDSTSATACICTNWSMCRLLCRFTRIRYQFPRSNICCFDYIFCYMSHACIVANATW
jgi:hypothetical protein